MIPEQEKINKSLSLVRRAWRKQPNITTLFRLKTKRFPIDNDTTNLFKNLNKSLEKINTRRLPLLSKTYLMAWHEKTIDSLKTPYVE